MARALTCEDCCRTEQREVGQHAGLQHAWLQIGSRDLNPGQVSRECADVLLYAKSGLAERRDCQVPNSYPYRSAALRDIFDLLHYDGFEQLRIEQVWLHLCQLMADTQQKADRVDAAEGAYAVSSDEISQPIWIEG